MAREQQPVECHPHHATSAHHAIVLHGYDFPRHARRVQVGAEHAALEGNDNDLSLVATLTYGDDSYLFAGDLEQEGIDAFLDGAMAQYDVLKMPHHGRKSGSTDELIESVRPKTTVITDSSDDPADKKTLKLLANAGSEVYRTSTDGTVVIDSDGSGGYSVATNA